MKRGLLAPPLAGLLVLGLASCGAGAPGAAAGSSAGPPAGHAPTEAEVLAAYDRAAEVYDWFSLSSLPAAGEPVEADGTPYDPERDGLPYQAVDHPEIATYADLEGRVRDCFAPELAEEILENAVGYRDIGGRLYTTGGARGRNLYLLDTTVAAAQTDEGHWTVTATFWADFVESAEAGAPEGDARSTPVAAAGYSQATMDYARTEDGWRFTSFRPSDDLDLEADTVFTFDYEREFEAASAWEDYSDWKLACYLVHADGGYREAPMDLLFRRFLERPEDILNVLALIDGSPYADVERYGTDSLVASPGYHAANSLSHEEQTAFLSLLDDCRPETPEAQAVLAKIRDAYDAARTETEGIALNQRFCLEIGGKILALGV